MLLIVSSPSEPLTQIQLRGLRALLKEEAIPITAWDKGCVVAVQWKRSASDLLDGANQALGGTVQTTSLQVGPDVAQFGFSAQNQSFGRLHWMLRRTEEENS